MDKLGEMLLRKLVVQENIFKELSGETNEKINQREGEVNLEKIKHEIIETLILLRLYL
jgi:hypothetical protein